MVLRVDYASSLPSVDRRDDGTLRVAANLTRTGVLSYTKPDGSPWKEYRPPSSVFDPQSLSSYGGRPLTIGHRLDAVAANTWREVAVGDVRDDAVPSGRFVRATVQISDAPTVARIDAGELVEVSCGYKCDLDPTPGVSPEGEEYDAVQKNIRLNHVALLPPNRGRAGPDVRLLLDSEGNILQEIHPKINAMADENYASAQKERADALEREAQAKREADALKGELAANKAALEKLRADMSEGDKRRGAEIAARVGLIDTAKKYLPDLRVDTADSDDAIKRAVIAKINPSLRCDDNAPAAFVDGMFRSLVASSAQDGGRRAVEAAISGAPTQAQAERADESEDLLSAAKARSDAFGRIAWTLTEKEIHRLARSAQARAVNPKDVKTLSRDSKRKF